MTYAERVKEDFVELERTWNDTKSPMEVMRRYIIQDILEIDRKGLERIEEEAADFDGSPEHIQPQLTLEEMEAKRKLAAALELMAKTWETICSIEDEFC